MKNKVLNILLLTLLGATSVALLVYSFNGGPKEDSKEKVVTTSRLGELVPYPEKLAKDTFIQPDTMIDESITTDYLLGKFDPLKDDRFTKIGSQHSSSEMYMRKEAYSAFKKMHASAKQDGINLTIISATRPFGHQKRIWEAKWTGKRKVDGILLSKEVKDPKLRALKILRWSSMPGTSRHHWGTDIDLNNLNNSYFESGAGKKIYEWLTANAGSFGFCQVYTEKGTDRPSGYEEEKWHWSFLPISKKLTRQYELRLSDKEIAGFIGADSAPMIEIVKKYVLGIHPSCR